MTKRSWVLLALSSLPAADLFAKRPTDYIPPPYLERVVRGFLGLAPLGALLAIFLLLALRKFACDRPAGAGKRFLRFAFLLTLTGAAVAAIDGWNDELWNPAFWASPFLAAIPLVAILLLVPRAALWKRLVLGIALAFPTWFGVMLGGSEWQVWGLDHGLPTSW
jgi:hypothetical protein